MMTALGMVSSAIISSRSQNDTSAWPQIPRRRYDFSSDDHAYGDHQRGHLSIDCLLRTSKAFAALAALAGVSERVEAVAVAVGGGCRCLCVAPATSADAASASGRRDDPAGISQARWTSSDYRRSRRMIA
jgi:hypothetical protein